MSARPRLLDLFSCAGGAAVGYARAGFEVVGVDITPQPRYPFEFIQADALELDPAVVATFDAIHASPPCQAYSDLAKRNGNGHMWPELIEPTREMLAASGLPYVIENVEGAPLRDYIVLCGTMFPELRVLRHRLFETSFPIYSPPHGRHPLVHTHARRKAHYGRTNEWDDYVQVTGGGNSTLAAASDAMGIDWMTKREINEAIPPAYAEYIGRTLIKIMPDKTGSKERIRQFLLAHVGEVVTGKQIQDAVGPGVTEWARRLRELREDEGWRIQSRVDDSSLKQGEYRLVEAPPERSSYRFSRRLSKRVRAEILERNGYTCKMCGAGAGEPDPENPGRVVRLHVGHIVDKSHGGTDDPSNLRALCSTCNQGARNLAQEPPSWTWVLSQLRRSSEADQKKAQEWLNRKFREDGDDDA